ncbi:MAG TPA: LuxR family transcriptional regulator [Micromonosporaceae bacterium]|nr:LuxR family transcriptional regulator [Micromonosporaceae bacterium]
MSQVHRSVTLRAPPDLRWTNPTVVLHCTRRLIRDALAASLSRAEFRVVGQVDEIAALPYLCGLRHPDLVVVDGGPDAAPMLDPLGKLRAQFGETRIVLIYDGLAPADLVVAERFGLDTLIPSSVGIESFLLLLRRRGATVGTQPTEPVNDQNLTAQEREVLAMLAAGHSVRHIANLLTVNVGAVESTKRRVYTKLRVSSKTQAVARAVQLGLIDALAPELPSASTPGSPEFTAREFDILRSIAMGHTVRQTARLLAIAVKTVENLQARLFLKLGTRNRAGAIRTAYALGLLDPSSEVPSRADPLTAVHNGR